MVIAYVASCSLHLGCYFLCTAQLTAPWLLCSLFLLHSPALWLLPAPALTFIPMYIPHIIIQLQNHAPWTLGARSPNPYSLLKYKREGVSWVPAISQMKKNICFYPIAHWGYSDGGGVLDQNQEKKQEQVIKNIISQLQATPEPYKGLDLLSQ